MEHAQEAATETESEGIRALRFEEQRGVVQGQLFKSIPEIIVVIGTDWKQARIDLRLDLLEAGQHRNVVRAFLLNDGVTHRRPMNVLDAGHHKADIPGFQNIRVFGFGIENTDLVRIPGLARRLHDDLVALLEGALSHPDQRHNPQVVVEPGVNNQCLQGCFSITLGWRDFPDQIFQNILDAQTTLGAAAHGVGCLYTNDVLNFLGYAIRLSLRQVHLVEHRNHFQPLFNRGVTVGDRLGLNALACIHHQQRTFTGVQ